MKKVLSYMMAGALASGAFIVYNQNKKEIVQSFNNMKKEMTRKCRKFKAMMQ